MSGRLLIEHNMYNDVMLRAVTALALVAGCAQSGSMYCAMGRVCPAGTACDDIHGLCVRPEQLSACVGVTVGEPCDIDAPGDGRCMDGVCLLPICGNGVREGAEDCDGADLGRDEEGQLIDCSDFGFHEPQPLTCRPDCIHDVDACSGPECGDQIVNGPEICDGAPPSQSCTAFGYDRGLLGCTLTCTPDFGGCEQTGWQESSVDAPSVLEAIWGSAPDNLYAIMAARILRYDGIEWTLAHAVSNPNTLHAIWGRSANDIFAVGSSGRIEHWDGTAWTSMTSTTTQRLRGIAGTATTVYAVGNAGAIVRFNGTSWSTEATPSTTPVLEAVGGSDGDVFAVGAFGTIWRRGTTGTWSTMTSNVPSTTTLYGVWAVAPDNVFAVGGNPNIPDTGIIVHYDGVDWTPMPLPTTERLAGIWGGDGQLFAVARDNGVILWFDGVRWIEMESPIGLELGSVFGLSADDVYAGSINRILRYRGTPFWSPQQVPAIADLRLYDVWAAHGGLAVAAGTSGSTGKILRFDGFAWTDVSPSNMPGFFAVAGTGEADIYVAGYGAIRRSSDGGMSWPADFTSQTPTFSAKGVGGVAGGPIIAVGNVGSNGSLRRRAAASDWQAETLPTTAQLHEISATSANDIWVAASYSVLHYTGSWTEQTIANGPTQLTSIWAQSPTQVLVAGVAGEIAEWNGTTWTTQRVGGPDDWTAIHGSGATRAFACGDNGKLWSWNGSSWSVFRVDTTETLNSVAVLPDRTYIVGDDGSIRLLVEPP